MYKNVMNDLEKYLYSNPDFNSRIPRYNDDSDYTTNAPSYYDDLARKNNLMKTLALRIWQYEEKMIKRLEQWDQNLEDFPEDVKDLLEKWLEDGTLDHIINDTIFNWKADKTYVDSELKKKVSKNELVVNVRDFGAVGDGVKDDSKSFNNAVEFIYNQDGGTLYIPKGTYLISSPIRLKGTGFSHADFSDGIKIIGEGWDSVLTGNDRGVASYGDQDKLSKEPIFAIHGSNNVFEDFRVIQARVCFYLGQDPRDLTVKSNTNYNRFTNLWTEYTGTSFLFQSGYGAYYNSFNNIHTRFGQIGIHFALGYFPNDEQSVPNRNSFDNFTVHHSWVGALIENGDTNTFNKCNFEQIQNASSNQYTGTAPFQVHDGVPTAIYMNNTLNDYGIEKWNFIACVLERCERHLYYDGHGNNFISNFMDSRRIELHPNAGKVGTFIGSYDSAWGGLSIGDFHINTSGSHPFSPIPTEHGVSTRDTKSAYLFDSGFRRTRIDITDMSDDIKEVYGSVSQNKAYFWSLSGERRLLLKCAFTPAGHITPNDQISFELPSAISNYFKTQSPESIYRFNAIVGNSEFAKYENVVGTFDYRKEKTILIPAPSDGWVVDESKNTVDYNYISFELSWFEDIN